MSLGWESSTKYTVKSASLRGVETELGMGNPRAPHPLPLYKTLQTFSSLDSQFAKGVTINQEYQVSNTNTNENTT